MAVFQLKMQKLRHVFDITPHAGWNDPHSIRMRLALNNPDLQTSWLMWYLCVCGRVFAWISPLNWWVAAVPHLSSSSWVSGLHQCLCVHKPGWSWCPVQVWLNTGWMNCSVTGHLCPPLSPIQRRLHAFLYFNQQSKWHKRISSLHREKAKNGNQQTATAYLSE